MLPVPGGILAQLADPNMQAMLAMKAASAAGPAAAPPPAAVQTPTLATNQAPVMPAPQAAEHLQGPDMATLANSLPSEAEPRRRGILSGIGDTLHDPTFRAQALRFAMGAFNGGPGGGLKAATDFTEARRAEAEDARRFDAETALKGRGLDLTGRGQDLDYQSQHEGHGVQKYGIDRGADTSLHGQAVDERNNIRSNYTARSNNHEDNTTSRANTHESVTASVLNNNTDNATARDVAAGNQQTDRDVAGIAAGAKNRLDPKDAMHGLGQVLPGVLGTNDAEGVAKALAAAPDLQAQLIDAYTTAYGDGTGNALDRATQAVRGVLGKGASYTDDNSWLPMHGDPEIKVGEKGNTGKTVVRTGTDKATGRKVNQYSDGSISYAD